MAKERIEFKYHPNFYESEMLEKGEGSCNCCGAKVEEYYSTMYCVEDVDCICIPCIASGKAAEKFDGTFSDYPEEYASDENKTDELLKRTPGYISWQGEHWQTCCDNYCAFLGDADSEVLEQLGICDELIAKYNQEYDMDLVKEDFDPECGCMSGYLFQCLHCKKYKFVADCD